MTNPSLPPVAEHANDLVLVRRIPASAQTLFRCWTEPELIKQWFVPSPWTIAHVDLDLRAGGHSLIVMQDPEGVQHPNPGVYLEVIPNQRLVFTDAYTAGWLPAAKPFMTAIISFEPQGEHTLYTARARHWTAEARQQHLDMGFEQGWGMCADQLQALAARMG